MLNAQTLKPNIKLGLKEECPPPTKHKQGQYSHLRLTLSPHLRSCQSATNVPQTKSKTYKQQGEERKKNSYYDKMNPTLATRLEQINSTLGYTRHHNYR